MIKKFIFALFVLCVFAAPVMADAIPSQLDTADKVLLWESFRNDIFSASLNIDACWDTTGTVNAGYTNRFRVSDLIDEDNYYLRSVVLKTSDDIKIMLFGNGINCKYADVDSTSGGYLRAGDSIALSFSGVTAVDSFYVQADNASTLVDIWVLAARPKLVAP